MKRRICLRIKGLWRVGEHFLFYDLDVRIRNDADASDTSCIEKVISQVKYKGIALPNLKKYVLNSECWKKSASHLNDQQCWRSSSVKGILIFTFGNIQVEEVAVKRCLYASSYNGNKVIESLKIVSVDPIDDVQSTVGTKCKQIVAGDGLSFTSLWYHKQLGQDGYWLQVDGEGPQDLQRELICFNKITI